jgi:WD40 repeat protein
MEASSSKWATLKGFRSPRGQASILSPDNLRRFNLFTRAELPWFNPVNGRAVDVSDDGKLVLVKEDRLLRWRLWEMDSNKPRNEYFDLPEVSPFELRYTPLLAPDNLTFAMTVVTDKRLLLWQGGNPKPQQLPRTGLSHPRRRTDYPYLAFSQDCRFLAGAQISPNGLVTVWDLPTGAIRWSLAQDRFVWALAIHPSGQFLAVATDYGSAGRVVRFLDAASGAEIRQFRWNTGRIQCLAFSPDGLTCAAGCSDRRLVIWDVDD